MSRITGTLHEDLRIFISPQSFVECEMLPICGENQNTDFVF